MAEFDPLGGPEDGADKRSGGNGGSGKAPRPRDAATLVLYRIDDDLPRLLMGRRSGGHDFMPDKYVFPGGRVDTEDAAAPALAELAPEENAALSLKCRRRARAFPLTAIRETFEETGLIVGREAEGPRNPPASWKAYFDLDVAPDLSTFTFVGRAVTPPARHKRFDARFFMADAAETLADDRPPVEGAELVDLRWFTFREALELDLPNVTRFVIGEIGERLKPKADPRRPFYLYWTPTGHRRDTL